MGTAFIAYTSAQEATRAKQQLNGVAAKGEQMNIAYDSRPPPGAGRNNSNNSKLIDRIAKPPLSSRLTDSEMKDVDAGPGPIRSRTPRGRGRGRGGKRSSPQSTPNPKTIEDLDKELEAFMGDGQKSTEVPVSTNAGDVAMT